MLVPRFLESLVSSMLAEFPIVMIEGPRQAGKTTLAKQFVDKVGPYVSLDDKVVRHRINVLGESKFVSELGRGAVIDEIQEWPGMTNVLKHEVDERPGNGRFLLTGSSSIRALSQASDSLAGRVCVLTLLPLSQAELRGGSSTLFLDFLLGDRTDPAGTSCSRFDLFKAIVAGGYPNLLSRNSARMRSAWLRNYCRTIYRRDIPAFGSLEARFKLADLLRFLAKRATGRVSIEVTRGPIQLSHGTVDKIFGILEDLNIISRLPNYLPKPDEFSLSKMRKLHFNDTGMLSALLKLSEASLERKELKPIAQGMLFEAFVYSEIAKLCHAQDADVSLGYWFYREKEVDLVIEHEGVITAVQITSSQQVKKEHFANLEELAGLVGNMHRGVVVHAGSDCLSFEHEGSRGKVTMLALPVSMLWASEQGLLDDREPSWL